MKKLLVRNILTLALALCSAGWLVTNVGAAEPTPAGTIQVSHPQWEFPQLAKIGFAQAIEAARKRVDGGVLQAELEDEDGFLVYGIELVTPDHSRVEVQVDAGTGEILVVDADGYPEEED